MESVASAPSHRARSASFRFRDTAGAAALRREMLAQVIDETRRTARNISSIAGLRAATDLPGNLSRYARVRARLRRRQRARRPQPARRRTA